MRACALKSEAYLKLLFLSGNYSRTSDTSGMELVHNSEMSVTLNKAQLWLQQFTLQARFQR